MRTAGWTIGVGLAILIGGAGACMVWFKQRMLTQIAVEHARIEAEEVERKLGRVRARAPAGDDDVSGLLADVAAKRAELADLLAGFIDGDDLRVDAEARAWLVDAGADAALLAPFERVSEAREFYTKHTFRVRFHSVDAARETAERLEQGALLHTWSNVNVEAQPAPAVAASVTLYSLLPDDVAPDAPPNEPYICHDIEHGVWLPPYSYRVREIERRRAELCASARERARGLQQVELLARLDLQSTPARMIRDALVAKPLPLTPQLPTP